MWARKKIISLKVYFIIKADDIKVTHDELKKQRFTFVFTWSSIVCHMILRNWNFPSRDVTFDDNSERPQSHEWYLLKVIFSIIVKLVMKLEKFTLWLGLNACLLDYVWRYLQVGFHTGFNFFWLTIYFSAVINSSNIIHRGVWFYSYSFETKNWKCL